jgi:HD-like signal output (HDOD) protein
VDLKQMSQRGMQVGQLARRIATAEGWSRQAVGDAFFAGLLYEVGLPVLAGAHPSRWAESAGRQPAGLVEARDLETELFGCSVTQASAYLLGLWGFHEPVVAAIATQPTDPASPDALPAGLLLSFARRWVCFPEEPQPSNPAGYLTPQRLDQWHEFVPHLSDQP